MGGPLRLASALLLLVVLVSCRPDGALVRAQVHNIPKTGTTLLVTAALDGKLSPPITPYTLTSEPDFSFGLQSLGIIAGNLVISVAVTRTEGATTCLLADGDVQVPISGRDVIDTEIRVEPPAQEQCFGAEGASPPLLDSIVPNRISSAGRDELGQAAVLRLKGWGFEPAMTITLGGGPALVFRYVSSREIIIDSPGKLPAGSYTLGLITSRGQLTIPGALTVFVAQPLTRLIAPDLPIPPEQIVDSAIMDVNADGRPDLLVLTSLGDLHIVTNGPSLQLRRSVVSVALAGYGISGAASMVVGDLDRGSLRRPELVVISRSGLVLLTADGLGSLAIVQSEPTLAGLDVALADFDRDGILDVVRGGTDLSVHLGRSGPAISRAPAYSLSYAVESVTVADLDLDEWPDIVTHSNPGGMSIFRSKALVFTARQSLDTLGGCGQGIPGTLALGDLDRNGYPDVLVNGGTVAFLNRAGDLTPSVIPGIAPCFGGEAVATVDLNRDSLVDLLWLVQPDMLSLLNLGDGRFADSSPVMIGIPSPRGTAPIGPRHVPTMDMDGDGVPDVVVRDHVVLVQ